MGRQRKAKMEIEYELERQISDLKQENAKLKRRLRELEKSERVDKKEDLVKVPEVKSCLQCGAKIKEFALPTGILELCQAACGYRNVRSIK